MTQKPLGNPSKPRRTLRRCPICPAPTVAEWRPFCSRRCADADLAHWLAGDYRVAAAEDEAETDGAMGAGEASDDDGTSER